LFQPAPNRCLDYRFAQFRNNNIDWHNRLFLPNTAFLGWQTRLYFPNKSLFDLAGFNVKRPLDQGFLVSGVPGRGTFCRARTSRAANIMQRPASADKRSQQGPHKFPRAHIFWLFLHPQNLSQVWVAIEDRLEIVGRKWIKLLDSPDGN